MFVERHSGGLFVGRKHQHALPFEFVAVPSKHGDLRINERGDGPDVFLLANPQKRLNIGRIVYSRNDIGLVGKVQGWRQPVVIDCNDPCLFPQRLFAILKKLATAAARSEHDAFGHNTRSLPPGSAF